VIAPIWRCQPFYPADRRSLTSGIRDTKAGGSSRGKADHSQTNQRVKTHSQFGALPSLHLRATVIDQRGDITQYRSLNIGDISWVMSVVTTAILMPITPLRLPPRVLPDWKAAQNEGPDADRRASPKQGRRRASAAPIIGRVISYFSLFMAEHPRHEPPKMFMLARTTERARPFGNRATRLSRLSRQR
jgi:hypothetical protein